MVPRSRIGVPCPVSPAAIPIIPGTRPASASETLAIGAAWNSAAFTLATDCPRLFFVVTTPAPVTTTSSSAMAWLESSKFAVTAWPSPTVTDCVSVP